MTHTHALFAEQSQSILDNLMKIIGPELSLESLGPERSDLQYEGSAKGETPLLLMPATLG